MTLPLWMGFSHDIPIASFNLTIEGSKIAIRIEFDKTDLEDVLSNELNEVQVKEYVQANTQWHLNTIDTPLDFCGFRSDHEHYYLEGELTAASDFIQTINIYNTCLVDEIVHHSNIIYVHQAAKEVMGFRLHQNRKQTLIDLAAE